MDSHTMADTASTFTERVTQATIYSSKVSDVQWRPNCSLTTAMIHRSKRTDTNNHWSEKPETAGVDLSNTRIVIFYHTD